MTILPYCKRHDVPLSFDDGEAPFLIPSVGDGWQVDLSDARCPRDTHTAERVRPERTCGHDHRRLPRAEACAAHLARRLNREQAAE